VDREHHEHHHHGHDDDRTDVDADAVVALGEVVEQDQQLGRLKRATCRI